MMSTAQVLDDNITSHDTIHMQRGIVLLTSSQLMVYLQDIHAAFGYCFFACTKGRLQSIFFFQSFTRSTLDFCKGICQFKLIRYSRTALLTVLFFEIMPPNAPIILDSNFLHISCSFAKYTIFHTFNHIEWLDFLRVQITMSIPSKLLCIVASTK